MRIEEIMFMKEFPKTVEHTVQGVIHIILMGFQSSKGHEMSPGLVTSKFCPVKHMRCNRGVSENNTKEVVTAKFAQFQIHHLDDSLTTHSPQTEPLTCIWMFTWQWPLKKCFFS